MPNKPRIALTGKQAAFVEHFIATGGKVKESARLAGYSAKNEQQLEVTASRVLRHKDVQKAIAERRQKFMDETFGTQEKRLFLWELAQRCGRPKTTRELKVIERDGKKVEQEIITIEVFDARAAIDAIDKLNKMDGDYAPAGGDPEDKAKFTIEETLRILRAVRTPPRGRVIEHEG